MKMKIAAAALRFGTELVVADTHFETVKKILKIPELSADQKISLLLNGEDGFITDAGKFVTREEAYKIAAEASQLNDHAWVEPERNKEIYGGAEPRLESDLIEAYEPFRVKRSYIS